MWEFDDGTRSNDAADQRTGGAERAADGTRRAGNARRAHQAQRFEDDLREERARRRGRRTPAGRRPLALLAALILVAVVVAAVTSYLTPGVTGLTAAVALGLLIAAVAMVISRRSSPRADGVGSGERNRDSHRLQIWLGILGAVATLAAAGITPLVERISTAGGNGGPVSAQTSAPGATSGAPRPSSSTDVSSAEPPLFPTPDANCSARRINVDTYRETKVPLQVSVQMDLAGRDHWPHDPRKLWVFVTGGGTEQYYPYEKAAERRDGAWVAYGVPFGRENTPNDMEMGLRYAVVALIPPAEATRLENRIKEPDFWTSGNPDGAGQIAVLPPGSEIYARIPVQLACV